ncbi:hypothetical protein PAPHI01_1772 [Pancytospora philotis]|nr:hypothetical protein PAPHI01_1772 [Pancytospora philotis]
MREEEIPLYDLATTPSYVVVAGGGGDPAYGKQNGIIVVARGSMDEESGHMLKTEDYIKDITVYADGAPCEDFAPEDYSCEESEPLEEEKEAGEEAKGAGSAAAVDNETAPEQPQSVAKPPREVCYITAIGEKYFYLVRYDGEFEILMKEKFSVKQVYFKKHLLLLLTDGTFHGFYDIVENYKSFELEAKEGRHIGRQEEFFYKLFRRGARMVCKREGGSTDVPENWDSFFICNGNVHKVLYKDGSSSFVFNNQKYTYEGRISRIAVAGAAVVFYTTDERGSQLRFIAAQQTLYQLPKITCMHAEGDAVAVVTSTGDAIVYVNGAYRSKKFLAYLPVTGISLVGKYAYYSVINGGIGYEKIRYSKYSFEIWIALIAVCIAVLYGMYRR